MSVMRTVVRVPRDFRPLLHRLSEWFHRPLTCQRLIILFAAKIVLVGERTVLAVIQLREIMESINACRFR